MEDKLVEIEEKDIGPGGRVTGLFFGFVLLVIAIWGVVINPMSRTIDSMQDSIIILEEAQKTLRERNSEIEANTRELLGIKDDVRANEQHINHHDVESSGYHARTEERLKSFDRRLNIIEEAHRK